jgi:hypothetical protein
MNLSHWGSVGDWSSGISDWSSSISDWASSISDWSNSGAGNSGESDDDGDLSKSPNNSEL